MGYNVGDEIIVVQFQGGARDFSLHSIQTSYGAYIAYCEMDNGGYVLGGKATGA
jgi:hypothetical protein